MVIQIRQNMDRFRSQDRTVSSRDYSKQNKAADVNFRGSPFKMSEAAKKKFYTSNGFKKFAKMTSNPSLLDATFVLALACVARPLTILGVGGAEKRDKQYASAHGFISGVYGYLTTLAIFNPINSAAKNVVKRSNEDPKYLEKSFIKNNQNNKEAFNFVVSYGSKLILHPLLCFGTIALLPLAMGLLFPKKDAHDKFKAKKESKAAETSQKTTPIAENKETTQVQFKGKVPNPHKSGTFMERLADKMGKPLEPFVAKLANNKVVKWYSETMAKANDSKSALMKQVINTGQALLGTIVYMGATMHNDKIEQDRKKTLATNHFITWGISALGTILLNETILKTFKKVANNYEKYNKEVLEENLKNSAATALEKAKILEKETEKIKFRSSGIATTAASMLAFAVIYRYITPVLATPLAELAKKIMPESKHKESPKPVAIKA